MNFFKRPASGVMNGYNSPLFKLISIANLYNNMLIKYTKCRNLLYLITVLLIITANFFSVIHKVRLPLYGIPIVAYLTFVKL
jgi:hypothetical protein